LESLQIPGLELLTDFQLQVENALDMQGRDLVLFVDASVSCRPPFEFARLEPVADASFSTHAISPSSVLEVYQRLLSQEPPPSYVLSIRGERFELGESLSAGAARNLDDALEFSRGLFRQSDAAAWDRLDSVLCPVSV
jgi:hydrogenase maturation protease